MTPFEFRDESDISRIFALSDGEEIRTLALFVLIQYGNVTDGHMDGHLCSGYTSACIACYATALVKIEVSMQKFYAPINPISAAVAELSSQKLKVPELTPLKMRGAGTPIRRVPPYFDPCRMLCLTQQCWLLSDSIAPSRDNSVD